MQEGIQLSPALPQSRQREKPREAGVALSRNAGVSGGCRRQGGRGGEHGGCGCEVPHLGFPTQVSKCEPQSHRSLAQPAPGRPEVSPTSFGFSCKGPHPL